MLKPFACYTLYSLPTCGTFLIRIPFWNLQNSRTFITLAEEISSASKTYVQYTYSAQEDSEYN